MAMLNRAFSSAERGVRRDGSTTVEARYYSKFLGVSFLLLKSGSSSEIDSEAVDSSRTELWRLLTPETPKYILNDSESLTDTTFGPSDDLIFERADGRVM